MSRTSCRFSCPNAVVESETEGESVSVPTGNGKHGMLVAKEQTYEIVYQWPSGREEVRYRRPVTDCRLAWEVVHLVRRARADGFISPYSIRRMTIHE